MAAPDGNSNALKWTLSAIGELVDKIDKRLDEDIDGDIIYMGQIFCMYRISSKQWHRIKARYGDDEPLVERMDLIEEQIKTRLSLGALRGTFKLNVVQLILSDRSGRQEENKITKNQNKEEMKKIEEEIDEAAIIGIEKEVGPLSAVFMNKKESREKLLIVAGKTKNEMRDMGFFYDNGAIIGPRPYIIVSDDFSFPL